MARPQGTRGHSSTGDWWDRRFSELKGPRQETDRDRRLRPFAQCSFRARLPNIPRGALAPTGVRHAPSNPVGGGNVRRRPTPRTDATAEPEQLAAALATWRETLMSVKESVDEATVAVGLLRATVQEMAPLWRSLGELGNALGEIDWPEAMGGTASGVEESPAEVAGHRPQAPAQVARLRPLAPAVPEEVLEPDAERSDLQEAADIPGTTDSPPPPEPGTPVLEIGGSYSCSVTVEEVGTRVKLAPLHRALGQIEGVRELSLRSYTNGVAVVTMDCAAEVDASALEEAIAAITDKPCRVVSGDGSSFLVRMGDNPAVHGGQ